MINDFEFRSVRNVWCWWITK